MKKTLAISAVSTIAFAAAQRIGALPMTPQHAALALVVPMCIGVAVLLWSCDPKTPPALLMLTATGVGAMIAGVVISDTYSGSAGIMVTLFASAAATAMLTAAIPQMRWVPSLSCLLGLISLLSGLWVLGGSKDAASVLLLVGFGTVLLSPLPFLDAIRRPG